MFVGFKPEPICQERFCNAWKKKNAEKKCIDNGLTYLGGSCLEEEEYISLAAMVSRSRHHYYLP